VFGFLIRNEVNDDAVRLKTIADQTVQRYFSLTYADLTEQIKSGFEEPQRYIGKRVQFCMLGVI
jgi:hypothetical protein